MPKRIVKTRGFSLIELLIVVAIILAIAAIAIPNLLQARISANQAAAVSTLRNINNSEATYISEFGASGYADNFVKLGPGNPCDATHACLVDNLIGCATQPCQKNGYNYFLSSSTTTAPVPDYVSTTTPLGWGGTGRENYCSATDGVLRRQLSPPGSLSGTVALSSCMNPAQFITLQ